MHQQRAIEHGLPGQILPDEDEPDAARFDDAQRDQTERMIEQMRGDVEEEDVARPKAEPPDHGLTSEAAAPLRVAVRSPPACPPRQWAAAAGSGAGRRPWRCRPCSSQPSFSSVP